MATISVVTAAVVTAAVVTATVVTAAIEAATGKPTASAEAAMNTVSSAAAKAAMATEAAAAAPPHIRHAAWSFNGTDKTLSARRAPAHSHRKAHRCHRQPCR